MNEDVQDRPLARFEHRFRVLHCEVCAYHMKRIVGRLPGVVEVSADVPSRTTTVTYDTSQILGEELQRMVQELDGRVARMARGLPPEEVEEVL